MLPRQLELEIKRDATAIPNQIHIQRQIHTDTAVRVGEDCRVGFPAREDGQLLLRLRE